MSSGSGQNFGLNGWLYTANELASHITSEYFVRIKNLMYSPMNILSSRQGLEPVHYFINPNSLTGKEPINGLISPTFTASDNVDYILPGIETRTLENFGDSLVFGGPNSSTFHIVPFTLTPGEVSKHYEYIAKDDSGNIVFGDERGGFHVYNGKPVFWNGRGTYQVFARTISETGFTSLNNDILTLEDQTIVAAETFENRLVVASLQGYLMWSQPNWDGVSVWQDSIGNSTNYLQLTTDPGEVVEFIKAFRGGLIVSTKKTSSQSGRILNIPTLDPTALQVIDTGVDSFFARNSVITSTDQMVGISPQGVLNISYDSLARTAKAEFNQTAPIMEYLHEVFFDNTVFPYLNSTLDAKRRKAYFIHDWSVNGQRKSKILQFDISADKWTLLESDLCIQKIFSMYDHICCAGWSRVNDRLVLNIWSFSDINVDVKTNAYKETIDGRDYFYWVEEDELPYEKSFVTGTLNISGVGPNEVPGTGQMPRQVLLSFTDPIEFALNFRTFMKDSWGGSVEDVLPCKVEYPTDNERWSQGQKNIGGKWDYTLKLHEMYRRQVMPLPNNDEYFQIMFKSTGDARIQIHSILKDTGLKS